MSAVASRGSRGAVLYALLLLTTIGLLLLTATWTPRWGVDVLAGTRVVVTPADPDATDADLDATAAELQSRARAAGAPGATVRRGSDGSFLVALPGRPDDRVLDALRSNDQVALRGVAAVGLTLPSLPPPPSGAPIAPPTADLATPDGSAAAWTLAPDDGWPAALAALRCDDPATAGMLAQQDADPRRPLLACDPTGVPLLLGPALVTGTAVDDARAELDAGTWAVDLDLEPGAAAIVAAAVTELMPVAEQRVAVAAEDEPDGSTGSEGSEESGAPDDEGDGSDQDEGPPLRVLAVTLDADLAAVGDAGVGGLADPDGGDGGDGEDGATGTSPEGVVAVADPTLDQRSAADVATRVRDGALPAAVDEVSVVRLGSTLDRDEGSHAAVAALVGLLGAVLAALALLRRRALLPVAAVVGTGALAAPGLLVADQVVGLALSLPVVVATLGALGVAPLLAIGILVVQERELPGRTPESAAARAGAEVWRRWWPSVAAGVVGAALVRTSAGDLVGDVAVAVGTVLLAALVTGRTLVRSGAVLLAGAAGEGRAAAAPTASATTPPAGTARPAPLVLAALAAVGLVAISGLVVRGVASDPAFTAGEEHLVTVSGDPVDARGAVRDAARDAGVAVSSLRDAGESTVLLTTPTLTDAERADLVGAVGAVPEVTGPVTTSRFDAAGSTRAWQVGAALLGLALLGGVVLGRRLVAAPVRLVPVVLAATAVDLLLGLGLASWVGVTWSPATLAGLGVVAVVGVTTHLAVVADRASGARLAPRYVAGSLLHLLPLAAVVVAAPSVRGPFAVVLAGLAVALTSALCLTAAAAGAAAAAPGGTPAVPPSRPDREVPVP
ncbi:preprotein translocase subunit SecD [Nocardioides zeae]|uniref:Preprotein translocase subunit SecD n=1 Tax=Nocardioides zeae TaxID=1457234 RepID=A0ACC6IJ29_9ACTN|nr:hypothetical protein [Nocardioides zeae]MDR6176356.1 preprotein translocase subunit SecD [Nocardioides zeae]MDR6210502.1 preprotein translocase subunit SecD [Nocardioides zeae]